MKHIIAVGASNSSRSINKRFASFAAAKLSEFSTEVLDLNDYEMPIYSIDREEAGGIPDLAVQFKEKLKNCDGIIISFAEHNGAYSVAFKNVMDWISRLEGKTWEDKPMLLLSTSPGGRGGKTVLGIAVNSFSRMNQSPVVSFSLPSFKANFQEESGIVDEELQSQFNEILSQFRQNVLEVSLV